MAQEKQVALVTGAAQGLGFHIASRLLDAGYNVLLSDINAVGAEEAAKTLDPTSEKVKAVKLDISSASDFSAAIDTAVTQWGDLHVLVNSAAMTKAVSTMELDPKDFTDLVSVNLGGTFTGCQVVGRYFATKGYGRIINMASLAGQNGGTSTGAHYAASKGGIITLTKVFAKELAASGVTVNAIAPGPIDSPMVQELVPEERLPALLGAIPVGQLGNADFIGDVVVQLAKPEAYFTTGATWDVNGGLFMR